MRVSGLIEENKATNCQYVVKLPYLEIQALSETLEQAFDTLKDEIAKLMKDYLKYSISIDDFKIKQNDDKSFDFSCNKANDFSLFILHRLRLINEQSKEATQENISKTGISNELLFDYENRKKEIPIYDFIKLSEALGYEVKLSFVRN